MTLKEKIKFLIKHKLASVIEIEQRNPELKIFALYYFLNNENSRTTKFEELEETVNKLIKEKIDMLQSLLK